MSCDHQKVLDLIKSGELEKAHKLIMNGSDNVSCLIHAYIHRAQGDLTNANYWYRKAGVEQPEISLKEELENLVIKVKQQQ